MSRMGDHAAVVSPLIALLLVARVATAVLAAPRGEDGTPLAHH